MNTQITNADVLRTVTASPMVDGFNVFTKAWPVKFAGPVPSREMLTVALLFGKNRKPGPESGFVAMQLRPEGASVAELAAAFNAGPAHNHSRELSADNKGEGLHYFIRTKGNGRFWLTFTAKGQKALEKALQGMAVQMAAGDATVTTDKPKAKKAATVAKTPKATSEAPKPVKPRKAKTGKGKPAETVSPELMQAVEAELAERGHELEQVPTETPVEPVAENHTQA
jgi:hypothetical protein